MKFVELKKSLKEKVLNGYVLLGDDLFLLYKSLELIKKQTVPNMPEINEIIFSENSSYSAKDVVEACLSYPIGDDFKLILIKDCNLKPTNENILILEKYLMQPNEKTCLVFFNSVNNDLCFKLKNIEKVDCNKLNSDLVVKLILQKCNEYNKIMNNDVAVKLSQYCLNNLSRIYNELEKLISYVGEERLITGDDVEVNVLKEIEFQTYEFANAVALKNNNRAFEILNEILIQKDSCGFIISSLYNQFSKMLFVAVSKSSDEELSQLLSTKPFAIKKTRELCDNFSQKGLKKIVELLSETEFNLKSGKISQNDLCENLVFKIINVM